jgi:hypothetical protein
MNTPSTQKSANDIFERLGALVDLTEEEFRRRMDEAVSKDNTRETMESVFPGLKKTTH